MKEYITKDGYKITKLGRIKKISFNNNGDPYFLWNGRKELFDNIMRLTYPVMWDDEDGKLHFASGYITISNCFGVLVELINGDEAIQLWTEEA